MNNIMRNKRILFVALAMSMVMLLPTSCGYNRPQQIPGYTRSLHK